MTVSSSINIIYRAHGVHSKAIHVISVVGPELDHPFPATSAAELHDETVVGRSQICEAIKCTICEAAYNDPACRIDGNGIWKLTGTGAILNQPSLSETAIQLGHKNIIGPLTASQISCSPSSHIDIVGVVNATGKDFLAAGCGICFNGSLCSICVVLHHDAIITASSCHAWKAAR